MILLHLLEMGGRSPRGTDMQNDNYPTFPCEAGVAPLQHNNAFTAATQPVAPAQIRAEQVSQPPVTQKEILKLKNRMNLLAQKVASFNSEPFEKYLISDADPSGPGIQALDLIIP